jgi:hypothetical protein
MFLFELVEKFLNLAPIGLIRMRALGDVCGQVAEVRVESNFFLRDVA